MGNLLGKIKNYGLTEGKSNADKKTIYLLNQLNLLLFLIFFSILLLELGLYFLTGNTLGLGTARVGLIAFFSFMNLVFAKQGWIHLSKASLVIFPGFILAYFPSLFGFVVSEFFLYVPYGLIAISVIPHFILRYDKEKRLYLFALGFFFIELLLADLVMLKLASDQIQIAPIIKENYLFFKVAQMAIFFFVNAAIFYSRRQNEKYEQNLEKAYSSLQEKTMKIEEQSDELLAQNMELKETREELQVQNEELKEAREELQAQNEELINFQEELHLQNENISKAYADLKNTQAKLVESEKMASIGLLTAGIAHEINNPVNFINSGVEGLKNLLEKLLEYMDRHHEAIDKCQNASEEIKQLQAEIDYEGVKTGIKTLTRDVQNGINRTNEIVRGLSTFSRSDEKEKQTCNLHDIIDSALNLLYNQYKNRINILKEYETLPQLPCYPGKLSQAFLNILINAIQAIEGEGTIQVKTHHEKEKNQLMIMVKDSGKGIPQGIKDNIFEPFFTTKEVGKGTGLGLSITKNIIHKHDGQIELNSLPGKGTECIIKIPVK